MGTWQQELGLRPFQEWQDHRKVQLPVQGGILQFPQSPVLRRHGRSWQYYRSRELWADHGRQRPAGDPIRVEVTFLSFMRADASSNSVGDPGTCPLGSAGGWGGDVAPYANPRLEHLTAPAFLLLEACLPRRALPA